MEQSPVLQLCSLAESGCRVGVRWRFCALITLLSLGGHATPVQGQQSTLLAGKPALLSNYVGGNGQLSIAGLAVDGVGNIYLTGATTSADLTTARAVQPSYKGGTDTFIVKLDQAGKVLFATYLGGGAQDWPTGIAVDSQENVYVTGWTASTDFPTLSAAQSSLRGRRNGFAAKFSAEGALIYSTYLGGTGDDSAAAIAVDFEGNAYITGATASPDFPVVGAIQPRASGGVDAFVTKLGAFGDIRYSTYLGGSAIDRGQGIAVDAEGRAYVAGVTSSYDFPSKGPFRGYSGGTDGFIARLTAEGDGLEYATWVGGKGDEQVSAVAVDSSGRAYVTGWTTSQDFPLVTPLQNSLRGAEDAFVFRVTTAGDGLSYSTYLGGSSADRGQAIAVDAAGRAQVTGWTRSSDFPAAGGSTSTRNALQEAYLSILSPTGAQLIYGGYVGSGGAEEGRDVAVAASGEIFLAGQTSTPTNQEGFLVRFDPVVPAPANVTAIHSASRTGSPQALSVSGVIAANTTWTLASSPISVTGNVEIAPGATLTIEAGVTVQFASGKVLQVDGQLIARGTAVSPIVFTSNQATPAPGQWGYILFNSDSVGATFDGAGNYLAGSILEYVAINSAGANVGGSGSNYAVWLLGGTPFINFATIQQNSGAGINMQNPEVSLVKITNSTLSNNGTGVIANGIGQLASGSPVAVTVMLQGNTITNNTTGVSLYAWPNGTASLADNVISNNNGAGVAITDYNSSGTINIVNNTIAGNQAGVQAWYGASSMSFTGNLVKGNTPLGGITLQAYPNSLVFSANVIVGNARTSDDLNAGGGVWFWGSGYPTSETTTIIDNIISNNTSAIEAGGIYLNTGLSTTFSQNSITGNIAPNFAAMEAIFSGLVQDTITQNTITQNQATTPGRSVVAIKNLGSSLTLSQNNWFNNAATYSLETLEPSTGPVLNAPNNWWGTTSTTAIQSQIYDFLVDGSRGMVSYAPALGAIATTAPVSPPENVSIAGAPSSLSLSWAPNPEPNIAGYKVYYSATPGPPYPGTGGTQGLSPIDVGNVTSYTLNLPANALYLAVTAYNTSHTGGATDQTNGFESAWAIFPTLQTITFAPLSDVRFGAAPFTISATASSTLTVAFASTTPLVCTVSGSTVTIVGVGTCSITASQAGNPNFAAAANVIQSFRVMQAAQTISFAALADVTFGAVPFHISATASSTLAVTFTSSTTAVCTVSGNIVTIASGGICSITANQAGNTNYALAAPVIQSFTVNPAPQVITFGTLNAAPLTATLPPLSATSSSGLSVIFATTTAAVCAVSGTAVTLVAAGVCSITASQNGNASFAMAAPVTQTFTVFASAQALQLVTVTPCRVMDTRGAGGPLGAPFVSGGTQRTIPVLSSACGIPANASVYSLNITAVPKTGTLGYLTIWPSGQLQPLVSTLNSPSGLIVANAAIVSAGAGGAISAYAADDTDLIIDINGYFAPPSPNTLEFYVLPPCRILDTRGSDGPFGGPSVPSGGNRSFSPPSSSCGVPPNAAAYALNVTAVPQGPLGYLTVWPAGHSQPVASTLNSLDGTVVANAALVPAGAGGAISFFAAGPTDLVVDINGYFAAPANGGLNFYGVAPCRVVDTRGADGTLGGPAPSAGLTRDFPLAEGACGLPATPAAQAYSTNLTVVPQGPLGYLTTWPTGGARPVVSTINAPEGQVVANAAIVPASTSGSISVFVTNATDVIIDTNGYFGR